MSDGQLRAREQEVEEGDEQELLKLGPRCSPVASSAGRPPSLVEILLMDMARSQAESSKALEGKLSPLTSGQRKLVLGQQSTEGKLSALNRGQQATEER